MDLLIVLLSERSGLLLVVLEQVLEGVELRGEVGVLLREVGYLAGEVGYLVGLRGVAPREG